MMRTICYLIVLAFGITVSYQRTIRVAVLLPGFEKEIAVIDEKTSSGRNSVEPLALMQMEFAELDRFLHNETSPRKLQISSPITLLEKVFNQAIADTMLRLSETNPNISDGMLQSFIYHLTVVVPDQQPIEPPMAQMSVKGNTSQNSTQPTSTVKPKTVFERNFQTALDLSRDPQFRAIAKAYKSEMWSGLLQIEPYFVDNEAKYMTLLASIHRQQRKYRTDESRSREEMLDLYNGVEFSFAKFDRDEFWAVIDLSSECSPDRADLLKEMVELAPRLTLLTTCPSFAVNEANEFNNEMMKVETDLLNGDKKLLGTLKFADNDLSPNQIVVGDAVDAASLASLIEALAIHFDWHRFRFIVTPMWHPYEELIKDVNRTLEARNLLDLAETEVENKKRKNEDETQYEYLENRHRFLITLGKSILCTRFLSNGNLCNFRQWFQKFVLNSESTAFILMLQYSSDLVSIFDEINRINAEESPQQKYALSQKAFFVLATAGFLDGQTAKTILEKAPSGIFLVVLKNPTEFDPPKLPAMELPSTDWFDAVRTKIGQMKSLSETVPTNNSKSSLQKLKVLARAVDQLELKLESTLAMHGVSRPLYSKVALLVHAMEAHQRQLYLDRAYHNLSVQRGVKLEGESKWINASMPLVVPLAHFLCGDTIVLQRNGSALEQFTFDAVNCSRQNAEFYIYNVKPLLKKADDVSKNVTNSTSYYRNVTLKVTLNQDLNNDYFYQQNYSGRNSKRTRHFVLTFKAVQSPKSASPKALSIIDSLANDEQGNVIWLGNFLKAPVELRCEYYYYENPNPGQKIVSRSNRQLKKIEINTPYCQSLRQRLSQDQGTGNLTEAIIGAMIVVLIVVSIASAWALIFRKRKKKKTSGSKAQVVAKFEEIRVQQDQDEDQQQGSQINNKSGQTPDSRQPKVALTPDLKNTSTTANESQATDIILPVPVTLGTPVIETIELQNVQNENILFGGVFGPGNDLRGVYQRNHSSVKVSSSGTSISIVQQPPSKLAVNQKAIMKTSKQQQQQQEPVAGVLMKAKFRDKDAFVTLLKKSSCNLDDQVIEELREATHLHHVNINQLLAVTTEPYHICIIQEYCSKGTLASVLARKKLQLDRLFKLSFASDIAAGMLFLHQSPIRSHGRLNSSNILVDSRWFCKIANIPLPKFELSDAFLKGTTSGGNQSRGGASRNAHSFGGSKREQLQREAFEDANRTNNSSVANNADRHIDLTQKFWTAPELLRRDYPPLRGSQKGDVYSFGIILYEIITRQKPYESYQLPQDVMFRRLLDGEYPAFRPNFGIKDHTLLDLADIARLCWDEVSAFRPDFAAINKMLCKNNKGKETNLIDQMMAMLENYANNLEGEVLARTAELDTEKRRSEELLSRMLPRTVIEELKAGRVVHPETYESVTVYFSDVVGFTKMASESTPLQIVDFLNDLYSQFDNIIDNFDVYKVETIGDAYMVASGLPVRNGNRHVAEIATLSLEILSCVASFKIRHRPGLQLQLRIGMHSGSVVAGIIGLKMPRYCLFGDTVNYASRMESSGLALRIHVSPESKRLLDKIGGFRFERRGRVSMKGKGEVETWHLVGKDGWDKPLPDLRLAASIEEHEFK